MDAAGGAEGSEGVEVACAVFAEAEVGALDDGAGVVLGDEVFEEGVGGEVEEVGGWLEPVDAGGAGEGEEVGALVEGGEAGWGVLWGEEGEGVGVEGEEGDAPSGGEGCGELDGTADDGGVAGVDAVEIAYGDDGGGGPHRCEG